MHAALQLLKKVPRGKVVTYQALARACRTSPRAIGTIMKYNKDPVSCPCYKVIKSNGELGGYSGLGGVATKAKLLERDGIRIVRGKVDGKYFHQF